MRRLYPLLLSALCLAGVYSTAHAISFSADAVQMRNGQFSYARMFWHDDLVRFEYVEDGVPMVQITDNKNGEVIWLDTESKQYQIENRKNGKSFDAMLKQSRSLTDPCKVFRKAECIKLKELKVNERDTVKWLITFSQGDYDQHLFQWIDKKLGMVIRQENPDGSTFDVFVQEHQEFNDRKVRKLEMYATTAAGVTMKGTQWVDEKLNIIVRQQNDHGEVDELRNIKTGKLDAKLFTIPDSYKKIKAGGVSSAQANTSVKLLTDNK